MSFHTRHLTSVLVIALGTLTSCLGHQGATVSTSEQERRCDRPFERRAKQVLLEHGASKTFAYFPEGEFEHQLARYPSKLCPLVALGDAIEAILLDDAEEALASVARERGLADCDSICLLNRSSSMIGIVADDHSRIENRLLPTAPTQPSLKAHWVFFVSVPDLSEHGYWALVARDGSGVTVVGVN